MEASLDWNDLVLRLVLASAAGATFGLDRGGHGEPAGMRTTLLVCLAAATAMIAANLLLQTNGKPADSFVATDPLRLPLGILSGMGFIGAGAIIKNGDRVQGLTTAATLWFVTVVGLAFGAGLVVLGMISTAGGVVILVVLRRIEMGSPS
jgi:putative Mg2+ transporter-C (MgtC) family protein